MKASAAPAGLPAVSADMAKTLKAWANDKGLIFHTHLGEGKMETERVAKEYGLGGEAEALEYLGILDNKTLLVLARSLARRFSVPKTQIGRLLGISSDVLDKLL